MTIYPHSFRLIAHCSGHEVAYFKVSEICQGGPEVGHLSIDGNVIEGHRFGGPFLCHNAFLYLPVYNRGGFRLGIIDLKSLSVRLIQQEENLILLDRIEDGKIYYYTDLDNTILKSLSIQLHDHQ